MRRPPVWRTASRREAGFTLLEVLIAFAIAAIALGVLYRGALGGLRATSVATRYEEAIARARSHMAVMGRAGPLTAGDQEGDDGGGFRWHTRVVPLGTTTGPGGPPAGAPPGGLLGGPAAARPSITLYAVNVVISWEQEGQRRQVELDSRRLGVAARPSP